MRIDHFEVDILMQGFPGKATHHGGLGWCSIAMIRGRDLVALVDVGSFGYRKLLIESLARHGLKPRDVTDILLTHAHYDHCVNWTLFPNARIVIGAKELGWALKEPWGETPVAELYVRELQTRSNLKVADEGDEVFPNVTAHFTPGHTPGHLIYVLHGGEKDTLFVGDAAKNRAELISRRVDMTCDPNLSAASIETIWDLWRARSSNVLVPGHDIPMIQRNGAIEYLDKRRAGIKGWFGKTLDDFRNFELTEEGS